MTKPKPCPPAPGPLEGYAAHFDDLFSRSPAVVKLSVSGLAEQASGRGGGGAVPCSDCGGHAGDLVPNGEAVPHFGAVVGGGHQVASGLEVGRDLTECGEELLGRPG
jgi:hypothetical protein